MVRPVAVACIAFVVLCAACGKTRVVEDRGSSWDDATEANGFFGSGDEACEKACVVEGARAVYATRTSPDVRAIAAVEDPSPTASMLFTDARCLAVGVRTDGLSGSIDCVRPDEDRIDTIARVGPPSALAFADRLYVADRDANGHSRIFGDGVVIASEENEVRALVAHRAGVFWIDAHRRIRRAEDHGVHLSTVADVERLDARFLAVDDSAFYAVRGGSLVRIVRGDIASSVDVLATAESPIRDVVLSGEWLYWSELGEARLACAADGSTPSCRGRGRPIIHPNGSLHRVRVVAPFEHQALARGLADADGILVARQFAYVSTRRGLLRVPTMIGSAPTLLATPGVAFGRPVLDTVSWTVFVRLRSDRASSRAKIVAVIP